MISMNSIILEGWKIHVESVADRKSRYELLLHQYENARLALIQPFSMSFSGILDWIFTYNTKLFFFFFFSQITVEIEEYESAAKLAEKYLDFTILVKICDVTQDDDRLMFYLDKYEKKVPHLTVLDDLIFTVSLNTVFDSRILLSSYFRGTFVKRNKANYWNNLDRIKSTSKH